MPPPANYSAPQRSVTHSLVPFPRRASRSAEHLIEQRALYITRNNQIKTNIMQTILSLIDWLSALNRWQLIALSVACLLCWLAFVALFLAGGYAGDRTDDEEHETETTK